MKTIEHFLKLRLCFQEVETHRSFEVSLQELAEVLFLFHAQCEAAVEKHGAGRAHLLETGRWKGKAVQALFQMFPGERHAVPSAGTFAAREV
jgi:hypothetical protein